MVLSRVLWWRGLFIGAALAAFAGQAMCGTRSVALVPMPRQVELRSGTASLGPGWTISSSGGAEDSAAVALLMGEGAECYGWKWRAAPAAARRRSIEFRALAPPAGAPVLFVEQGYRLEITRDHVVVEGATAMGRFYGAQTLRQLFRSHPNGVLPCLRIEDYPALAWRGISDDISRGQISTLDDFKRIIRQLGYYKINLYQLYIEDMFRFEGARTSGETRGALTKADLEALVNEGRANHVVVSPIFQTLTHQERLLGLTEHQRLAAAPQRSAATAPERAWMAITDAVREILGRFAPPRPEQTAASAASAAFSARDPRALQFVQSLVDELASVTRGPFFHIGGDEWQPAGKSTRAAGETSEDAVRSYGRYLGKVANHVRERYGCRAMVYGDVILKHPEAAVDLPRNVIVVDWNYYPLDSFPSVRKIQRQGFRDVMVSPGLWTWRTFYPNYASGFRNVAAFSQAGKQAGALGCITAAWGDGGSENLRENNWAGYAFAAAASWESIAPDPDVFLRRFTITHHGTDRRELADAMKLLGWQEFPEIGYAGKLYHRSLPVRPRASQSLARMRALAADMRRVEAQFAAVEASVRFNKDQLTAARHCAQRLQYVAERELLLDAAGRSLAGRTTAQLSPADRAEIVRQFGQLETTANALQADYRLLWLSRNRPEGLRENDERMGKQVVMLRRLRELARSGSLKVDQSYLKLQAPIKSADVVKGGLVP